MPLKDNSHVQEVKPLLQKVKPHPLGTCTEVETPPSVGGPSPVGPTLPEYRVQGSKVLLGWSLRGPKLMGLH